MKYLVTPHLSRPMLPFGYGWTENTARQKLTEVEALHGCPEMMIEASSLVEALEATFLQCNDGDLSNDYRAQNNRSLSVGDVISIREETRSESEDSNWYLVMPLGFSQVDWNDIYDLLTGEPWYDAVIRDEQEASR